MRQRGFSLLELLVAFAIMSMSIGLLYRMAGGSARSVADTIQQQEAVWLAESILASRNSVTNAGWNESGELNNLKWEVRSQLVASGESSPLAIPLHEIRLSVFWVGGSRPGQLELQTLLPQRKPLPGEVIR